MVLSSAFFFMRAQPDERSLVISQGDPEGVGPELLLRLAADKELFRADRVIADPERLGRLAHRLEVPWAEPGWRALQPLLDTSLGGPAPTGQVDALARAVDLVLAEPGTALVTAPIDKAAAREEGFDHPGHTDYLAERCGVDEVVMLMAGDRIRVGLATAHLPLRQVPDALTRERIVFAGQLLATSLREHFGVQRPCVGILGLNPHAGERGLLGLEEARVIEPAVADLKEQAAEGVSFVGPLPADSAFFFHVQKSMDGLLAMYHDQGLGPFKLLHFHDGINMTLGLPFLRTSPDHGTAKDIAGRGVVDPSSMIAAVRMARGKAP
jgi:4-hydroxythreonine-4-phosphate dehydrogenase